MPAKRTSRPDVRRLEMDGNARQDGLSALRETGLLRHRPPCALPVQWHATPDGMIDFTMDTTGLIPLSERMENDAPEPRIGYRWLLAIMEAMHALDDRFFPIGPALCHPDLIFIDPKADEDAAHAVRLVALPFDTLDEGDADDTPLMDALAATYAWPESVAERLRTLWRRRALFDLLLEARILVNEPASHDTPDPPMNGWRAAIASMRQRIRTVFFQSHDMDILHESTEPFRDDGMLSMAQLSEGLPGTPDEGSGRMAYILTDRFVIGRDLSKADLVLDDVSVSRRHAEIVRKDGQYYVEDLGSKNGTTLDGIRLNRHRSYLLPTKCRLGFADALFYFRSDR
ncbi:MAG: FHA domain-containing protein [Saccharofermentanales bacterium]|jgi:hypothetical protein